VGDGVVDEHCGLGRVGEVGEENVFADLDGSAIEEGGGAVSSSTRGENESGSGAGVAIGKARPRPRSPG
jgi:hypothetical protein